MFEEQKKQVGSYTDFFRSGKRYHGKGPKKRAKQSGEQIAGENDDELDTIDWEASENDREAFKDEYERLRKDKGPENPDNYNKIESPGKKYTEEDNKKNSENN